jgi:hypothetical protein
MFFDLASNYVRMVFKEFAAWRTIEKELLVGVALRMPFTLRSS